ncbi:tryptophan synthase, alpha subunit [Thermoanaerobacterium thermosaccharolyticum DSM 571]|jgi:tryptophan synthase alpha chain|uniref:Tryptophan synthase alpha chain n=1 Tax=Thermoanaerobacterium thermosaccharolyticum (strain ATCC 7956 / DSM 571 / NCIMB 9385 / NCA 3814 / NCTC 13789 / WDCM 00135 / 2032) TaxID=580327 RepID=D9TPR7_THETC|nr:tryptophan synthase, alpha subunit [Thermoanaerobacterium thermosaccharolyticum DSM 571]KAA5805661.1 tryptophan synthase subunit alpha [Thermoanaerobacterium thermosaccharolyticum]
MSALNNEMNTVASMNRIDKKFYELKQKGLKAMIPFITAGDPSLDVTVELVFKMEEGGADIIEIGIPYSDPLADGPIIQASSTRALKNGTKINNIMNAVKKIRQKSEIPLVYLVYYNSIFKYGIERFVNEAKESGIDGLIIPDLPLEERKDIKEISEKYGIYLIPLVAPTSKERIKSICESGKGFVYCVSTKGVTGIRNSIETDIKEYMRTVSEYTNMPKAIGFGISGPDMAKRFAPYCDGIIVGSAIVKMINDSRSKEEIYDNVKKFVFSIKEAI